MCLALPMQVMEIDGLMARCEARGIERRVSLFMLQHEDVRPGDMVIVHVGYALQKVAPDEARGAWALYDEWQAAADADDAADIGSRDA
jgi:hydrogenase expression/formation protein HypC